MPLQAGVVSVSIVVNLATKRWLLGTRKEPRSQSGLPSASSESHSSHSFCCNVFTQFGILSFSTRRKQFVLLQPAAAVTTISINTNSNQQPAAAAVEFDSTVTRTWNSQLNCTAFGHACWTCFQSCAFQSYLWCLPLL